MPDGSGEVVRLAASVLVGWELFIGCCALLNRRSPVLLSAMMGTLIVFTIGLVALWSDPAAPKCGCFGAFGFSSRGVEFGTGILRNLALLWLVVLVLRERPRSAGERVEGSRTPAGMAPGFTLVEVLVSVLVIAVMIAVALPHLVSARREARISNNVAVQRGLVVGVGCYTAEWRDSFPYFAAPGEELTRLTIRGSVIGPKLHTFTDQSRYWACALSQGYLQVPESVLRYPGPTVSIANSYPEWLFRTRYRMTYAMFAAPDLFTPEFDPRFVGAGLRGTQVAEVLFPSAKGMTLDTVTLNADGEKPGSELAIASLFDGSARRFRPSSLKKDNVFVPELVDWPAHVISTQNGLRGRDFE